MRFTDIIDSKNKLKYSRLVDYVDCVAQSDFIKEVGMPFLMGKDLYEGHLASKTEDRDTLKFLHVNDVLGVTGDVQTHTQPLSRLKPGPAKSAISHAVYAVQKSKGAELAEYNIISIGRSPENDITIVDYAISKEHAVIRHRNGVFYIEDLNSTNGICVNAEQIQPGVEISLSFGSSVNLGRFGLVFVRPIDLYDAIKVEVMVEKARGLRS